MGSENEVLVVEDDTDMREVIETTLAECGFDVRTARDGREAVEKVAEHRPAVVLLDMLMPVMDGWRCAKELRARYGESLPIIVMTAAEHAGQRALDIGANGALTKPFLLEDLLSLVERYAGAPH